MTEDEFCTTCELWIVYPLPWWFACRSRWWRDEIVSAAHLDTIAESERADAADRDQLDLETR